MICSSNTLDGLFVQTLSKLRLIQGPVLFWRVVLWFQTITEFVLCSWFQTQAKKTISLFTLVKACTRFVKKCVHRVVPPLVVVSDGCSHSKPRELMELCPVECTSNLGLLTSWVTKIIDMIHFSANCLSPAFRYTLTDSVSVIRDGLESFDYASCRRCTESPTGSGRNETKPKSLAYWGNWVNSIPSVFGIWDGRISWPRGCRSVSVALRWKTSIINYYSKV